jgi:hypothetical protein
VAVACVRHGIVVAQILTQKKWSSLCSDLIYGAPDTGFLHIYVARVRGSVYVIIVFYLGSFASLPNHTIWGLGIQWEAIDWNAQWGQAAAVEQLRDCKEKA